MIRSKCLLLFGSLWAACFAVECRADEQALKQAIASYLEAFNQQDIEALASGWTENATHTDLQTGDLTAGRAAITNGIAEGFQQDSQRRLSGSVQQIRMVRPDVALVTGKTTLFAAQQPVSQAHFSAVMVLQDGKWLIESLEEANVLAPVSPASALRGLEWLVGQWLDDTAGEPVETTIRWTPDRAFLLRSFLSRSDQEVTARGTQVIGWDPRGQQIRSWTFHSDGSFGDATWSQNGEDWLIKTSQTLADGRAASGTFVLSPQNQDAFTLQLIGHEIEGEPQPTKPPVQVKRVLDNSTAEAAPAVRAAPAATPSNNGAQR